MFRQKIAIPEGTYVELVQSLYRTLPPTLIIAVSFVTIAAGVAMQTRDLALTGLAIAGSISVAIRIVVLLLFRRQAADPGLSVTRARQLERIFAVSYLSFAAIFGLFSAWALAVATQDVHIIVTGLLVGYAAGVAAGISYRPWISVSAMLLGVIPSIAVSVASSDPLYWGLGALLTVFLAGGVQSMLSHYRLASGGITMTRLFADLARSDVLTGLPNRFELAERYNQVTMMGRASGDIAVHYLDLDQFKPVNDRYGHPVGDLLLQAVADRLSRTLRGKDFAARIGGDEFVVVQSGVNDATEAQLLARRIVKVVSEPYTIGDHTITIGTSVGFALVSEHGHALDKLIEAADQALLSAKAAGGGCVIQDSVLCRTG